MRNLPDGVQLSDIPGNRPQDERHDRIMNRAWRNLPSRFNETLTLLRKIDTTDDAEEFATACNDLVNLFYPTKTEQERARRIGFTIDTKDILSLWLSQIEDAGIIAGEYAEPPVQEYEADYDMGDL